MLFFWDSPSYRQILRYFTQLHRLGQNPPIHFYFPQYTIHAGYLGISASSKLSEPSWLLKRQKMSSCAGALSREEFRHWKMMVRSKLSSLLWFQLHRLQFGLNCQNQMSHPLLVWERHQGTICLAQPNWPIMAGYWGSILWRDLNI